MPETLSVVLFAVGLSFVLNLVFTPVVLRMAHWNRWYDTIGHRKVHTGEVPRIGGVGIFAAFLLGVIGSLVFARAIAPGLPIVVDPRIGFAAIGLTMTHMLGLFDDFRNVRAISKLLGQILAAALIIIGGGLVRNIAIPVFGTVVSLGPFSGLFTILWIISISNAINLVDGLDGLAGGISLFISVAFGLMHLMYGNIVGALIAFALAGAVLGFLVFNFPPAKLFMGDSGSLFLGVCLAVIPFLGTPIPDLARVPAGNVALSAGLFAVITVLFVPIMDMIAAILRRARKGLPIYHPDREHLHHKLLDFGLGTRTILLIVYPVGVSFGVVGVLWVLLPRPWNDVVLVAAWVTGAALFLTLHYSNRRRKRAAAGSG